MQPSEDSLAAKVMIVDDNLVNLKINEAALKKRGLETILIQNPTLVEDQITTSKPSIILLDLMMPELEGSELLRRIRKRFNKIELPIFIVTSKNQGQDLVDCLDAGANDFIRKPINPKILFTKIKAQLDLTTALGNLEKYEKQNRQAAHELALSHLSHNLAHEINNPLAIVHGRFSQLEKKLTKREKYDRNSLMETYSRVSTGIKRIENIIENLEIISSQTPEKGSVVSNLSLMYDTFQNIWSPELSKRGIAAEFQSSISNLKIEGHATQIIKALSNIMINAVEASAALTDPRISVVFESDQTEGNNDAVIKIRNKGQIPDDLTIEKLFEPFFTTKKNSESIGLGLSVSQGIISRFGGDLSLVSENAETEFVCRLKIAI